MGMHVIPIFVHTGNCTVIACVNDLTQGIRLFPSNVVPESIKISFLYAWLLLNIVYRCTASPDYGNTQQSLSDLDVYEQIGQIVKKNR
jgi:hypothetical protein